ncbi:hypothetical protein TSH7_04625 [Azospirillum sp. TSH7]|nr:hypothetical protein TSH7_04625 [Azospirillum sp. TSH7]
MDEDAKQETQSIDHDVGLATLDLFGRVKASGAPFSVVLALWVLRMVADGVGPRPSSWRSITKRGRRPSHSPASRRARK